MAGWNRESTVSRTPYQEFSESQIRYFHIKDMYMILRGKEERIRR